MRAPAPIPQPVDLGLRWDAVAMAPEKLTISVGMLYDPQTPGLDPDCTFTLIAWRAFHGTIGRPVVLVAAPQSVRLHAHQLTQDVTFAFPALSRDVPGKYRFFCLADCADEVPELGDASKGLNNLCRYPMDGFVTWPPS